MNEKTWARRGASERIHDLAKLKLPSAKITVSDGRKLPYSCEIREYPDDESLVTTTSSYETDLLICDTKEDRRKERKGVARRKGVGDV